ncbi:MAG TPA: BtpA/SgcQ family protein [Planctomycetota bacterium]|nr:BtpA/SgcQ family protein [Planctomycetota bacterium]
MSASPLRPLLGVVHLLPCPSSARGSPDVEAIIAAALRDARALADGGVDGIVVENFGDAPFHKGTRDDPVPPDVVATLAIVAREVRAATGLPLAINCLRNDACAALGIAAATGARWVRVNVLAGAMLTDQGVIEGEAARVLAYRKQLGRDTKILADLLVKHAVPLAPVDPLVVARDLAARAGADALIVTGTRTGAAVDADFLRRVKASVGGFPVWIGSGLSEANAATLWPQCDGAIVASSLKTDGRIDAPIDAARVRRLRALCPPG